MPWNDIARRDIARGTRRYCRAHDGSEWRWSRPSCLRRGRSVVPGRRTFGRWRTRSAISLPNRLPVALLPEDLPPPLAVQRYFSDGADTRRRRSVQFREAG